MAGNLNPSSHGRALIVCTTNQKIDVRSIDGMRGALLATEAVCGDCTGAASMSYGNICVDGSVDSSLLLRVKQEAREVA